MLFQPSNIYPSTLSGIGAGTVDVTQGLNVSWQVNGDTPMTAYQIKIYQNDTASTLKYDSGSVSVSPAFETHDRYGNPTFYTVLLSAATLSTAGIVNGYQYGYKMLITQWWGVSDYVEQTSASVFITRSLPTISIDAIPNPVTSSSLTITATYAQAQGDPISTVDWVFALAGSESNPIKNTGAVNTQVLSFDADGLINGNTYSIMCTVVTANGMEASTGFVQFTVSYSSSSLGINYQLAQLKNSSAVYLSWDDLGSNVLSYPYTDSTKTTNGITFTVNGEGDVVVTGTATADAYFAIAQGTLSQLGITAGQKLIVTSGYSGAKIVVTETNSSNVVVSTITGNDPLQYIATSTTNTLKFSIVIPSGASFGTSQQLQPMIAIEDKIVALNDLSVTMQPIQDLHGYANPWPAGGGKNLFDANSVLTGYISNDSGALLPYDNSVASDYIAVEGGQNYRISPVLTSGNWGAWYDENKVFISGITGYSTAKTAPSNAKYLRFTVSRSGNNPNYATTTQVETGSEPTSWTPYSNICPISGRTGLNVYRTGKNLIDPSNIEQGGFLSNGRNDSTSSAAHNQRIRSKDFVPVTAGQAYTVSFTSNGTALNVSVSYYANANYEEDRIGSSGGWSASPLTVTIPSGANYVRLLFKMNDDSQLDPSALATVQLESGSATTYEPYNGNTYAVDWTSQAGTVYGGTLDVVTGLLTVDWTLKTLTGSPNEVWDNYNGGIGGYILGGLSGHVLENYGDGWCNMFPTSKSINTAGIIYGMNSRYAFVMGAKQYASSISEWKTWLASNPLQIVYKLGTPLTYQLTPQEVAALVTNNVWTNAGDVTVSYTTDTGEQATITGAIVSFSNTNAQSIQTPQFIPGITGLSIYRYLQGELALQHVYDLATGATSILDYFAPSQTRVSYLLVAHSNVGDLFLQTNDFVPTFWFYSVLLCDTDSNGNYHVSREYIFKYGVETGAISNNNGPTIQKNFTPYPNRQPISSLYKTGKLSGYIGKTNNLNQYSDTISLQNAIFEISTSSLTKFIKTRKGDILMADTAAPIQMQTEDNTTEQALKATIDWVEVGDADQVSIVSISTDPFWPLP